MGTSRRGLGRWGGVAGRRRGVWGGCGCSPDPRPPPQSERGVGAQGAAQPGDGAAVPAGLHLPGALPLLLPPAALWCPQPAAVSTNKHPRATDPTLGTPKYPPEPQIPPWGPKTPPQNHKSNPEDPKTPPRTTNPVMGSPKHPPEPQIPLWGPQNSSQYHRSNPGDPKMPPSTTLATLNPTLGLPLHPVLQPQSHPMTPIPPCNPKSHPGTPNPTLGPPYILSSNPKSHPGTPNPIL